LKQSLVRCDEDVKLPKDKIIFAIVFLKLFGATGILSKIKTPVEDGIVFYVKDYLYSSAKDYGEEKGLVRISLL